MSGRDPEDQPHAFHDVVEAVPTAVMITDRDGIIEWVNPAFPRTTGCTLDEGVGRTPGSLIASGRQDGTFYRDLRETIAAGRVWHGRLVNRRKDGSLYPEERGITPVREVVGRITYHRTALIPHANRGKDGHLPPHRGVVQPPPAPLRHRVRVPRELREEACAGRVRSTGDRAAQFSTCYCGERWGGARLAARGKLPPPNQVFTRPPHRFGVTPV